MTHRHNLSNAVAPAATAFALGALVVRPQSAGLWLVVAALLALATFESLTVVRDAVDTAVAVSAAAERLEELEVPRRRGLLLWPLDQTIRLDGVTIDEGGATLLRDVTFAVTPGRKVAVTGASGVGKSTLLRAIAALDDVSGGTITIGDVAIAEIEERALRHSLTFVASEPGLTRGFAIDVVGFGRSSSRSPLADVAALGLAVDATTRWEDLSRGERVRVAIARASFTSPLVYVLDEPTSGLGSEETASVLSLLASTGASVIVATHDPQVMAWCDEVLELRDGVLREIRR
jgi:putative ABC transport system ATP-binding protein